MLPSYWAQHSEASAAIGGKVLQMAAKRYWRGCEIITNIFLQQKIHATSIKQNL
jgi:hypothetical protein